MFANVIHVWEKILQTLKCSSGHVECSFDNLAEKFSSKAWIFFCSKSENNNKIIFFWQKIFFLKKVLWTRRLQLWQPCWFFLVFFEKKLTFSEKNWFFFQNRSRWQFCCRMRTKWFYFSKCLFHLNCELLQKIRKFLNLEKLQNLTKKQYVFKIKNVVIFLKGIFNRIGGQKICRCKPAVLL